MKRRDFENHLKVLHSLDLHELIEADVLDAGGWSHFTMSPIDWLLKADDGQADRLWTLIEHRASPVPRHPPEGHCNDVAAWADFSLLYGPLERKQLAGGDLTDFEAAFDIAMLSRNDFDHEMRLHIARDRIRWLSIQLAKVQPKETT